MLLTNFNSISSYLSRSLGELYIENNRKGERTEKLIELAKKNNVKIVTGSKQELLKRVNNSKEYRGYFLQINSANLKKKYDSFDDYLADGVNSNSLVVILDGIMDTGNFGAILRSCDQFMADCVLTPIKNTVSTHTGFKHNDTSSGASAWMPVFQLNLHQATRDLKEAGFWVFSTGLEGTPIFEEKFNHPVAIILGNERKGVSRLLLEDSDGVLTIPTSGYVDSLNVSVATGIALYQITVSRLNNNR